MNLTFRASTVAIYPFTETMIFSLKEQVQVTNSRNKILKFPEIQIIAITSKSVSLESGGNISWDMILIKVTKLFQTFASK